MFDHIMKSWMPIAASACFLAFWLGLGAALIWRPNAREKAQCDAGTLLK